MQILNVKRAYIVINSMYIMYSRTPEGCDKLGHRESVEEEEEDDMFPCSTHSTIKEEPANDSETEEPVWDFGIRRSGSSKVSGACI